MIKNKYKYKNIAEGLLRELETKITNQYMREIVELSLKISENSEEIADYNTTVASFIDEYDPTLMS